MAQDSDPRVDELQKRVEALTKLVEELQAALDGARQGADLTMRKWLRCPNCGCRRIAHAISVLDRGDGNLREKMALVKPGWWSDKTLGELEAYTCTACGAVEWYAKEPEKLTEVKKYMRILDGDVEADGNGPYR